MQDPTEILTALESHVGLIPVHAHDKNEIIANWSAKDARNRISLATMRVVLRGTRIRFIKLLQPQEAEPVWVDCHLTTAANTLWHYSDQRTPNTYSARA